MGMSDSESEDWRGLLNHAYFYLKFRPRTKKEIHAYLLKKIKKRHWSTDDVEKVMGLLQEQKFIDDQAFVKWYLEGRNKSKPKGKRALQIELSRLGIEKELIDSSLESMDENEIELARRALEPRWKRYKDLDSRKCFEKASRFLGSRGFSFDTIQTVISQLEESS